LYYSEIYGYRESYPVPLMYQVFDLSRQGVPIVLLDATFDKMAFLLLYSRYCFEEEQLSRSVLSHKELNPVNDVKIRIYESFLKDKDTKIYRINSDSNYYESGFFNKGKNKPQSDKNDHNAVIKPKKDNYSNSSNKTKGELNPYGEKTINDIKKNIRRVLRKHKYVGVVTTDDLETYFESMDNVIVEHFHNLKGLNTLKNVGALFVVGTPPYNQGELIEDYNNLCLIDMVKDDFYFPEQATVHGEHYVLDEDGFMMGEVKFEEDNVRYGGYDKKRLRVLTPRGFDDFVLKMDYKRRKQMESGEVDLFISYWATDFQYNRYDSEIYQAVMRARLFRNEKKEGKSPEVFMYCYVPDVLDEEFDIEGIDRDKEDQFFLKNYFGVYPLVLLGSVNKYARLNFTNDTNKIARKLNIKKKDGSPNGSFVKEMREAGTRDIEMIDTDIKKGAKTVKAVRRMHSKEIGVSDEFIEYCIYYAHKGSVIKVL